MILATWNPNAPAGHRLAEAAKFLAQHPADVAVLTKTTPGIAPREGHHLRPATIDPDYPRNGTRRVVLWSRWPLTDHDAVGHPDLPPGRFVAATVHHPTTGPIRVVGVCLPWRDAHVTSGRRDRAWWEEHIAFLERLTAILTSQPRPLILAGDMNQQIPRRLPKQVTATAHQALTTTLTAAGLYPVTGHTPGVGRPVIDHIAVDHQALTWTAPEVIDARPVTRHDLIRVEVTPRGRHARTAGWLAGAPPRA